MEDIRGESCIKFEKRMKESIKRTMKNLITDAEYEERRVSKSDAQDIYIIVDAFLDNIDNFFEPDNINKILKDARKKIKNKPKEFIEK